MAEYTPTRNGFKVTSNSFIGFTSNDVKLEVSKSKLISAVQDVAADQAPDQDVKQFAANYGTGLGSINFEVSHNPKTEVVTVKGGGSAFGGGGDFKVVWDSQKREVISAEGFGGAKIAGAVKGGAFGVVVGLDTSLRLGLVIDADSLDLIAKGVVDIEALIVDFKYENEYRLELFEFDDKCFAAGTLISLPDGSSQPIELLSEASEVSSYKGSFELGRSSLEAGTVVKLYQNVTQEFLRLSFADGREPLIVTPGHAFLDETGGFTKIGELVDDGNGSARVIDQSGSVVEVTSELLRFDADTADLFERSSKRTIYADGQCVLDEEVPEGWKTYNFEVEGLHTYIAGGVRVHNQSGFLGQVGNTIDEKFFDQLGTLGDGIGDIVTSPFHVAGEILDGATRAVSAIGTGISKGIGRFGEGDIFGGIAEIGKGIGNAFREIGRTAAEVVSEIGSSFMEGISKVGQGISDFVGSIFGDNDTNDGKGDDNSKPVIIDLDGDGIEVSDSAEVNFDMDGDGYLEQTAWADVDDGFLVLDLNADGTRGAGDGKIDQTNELVLSKWLDWDGATDLQALATFDEWESRGGNNDGVLDAQDEVWSELHVWQDLNQNGITDAGELKSFEQLGITQINLKYDDGTDYADLSNDVTIEDNSVLGLASYTRDGEVIEGGVGDMSLSYTAEGWRRVATVTGYRIEFENNENYEYRVLAGSGSSDVNLMADALGGATGDERSNRLDASGYDTAVQISGLGGDDVLTGGNQDDLISGGSGADELRGGDGADTLFFDEHDTVVLGGNGFDTANYTGEVALTFDLKSHGVEALHAGKGDDTITASGATETVAIFGNDGNDTVSGGAGDDILSGGIGNDTLRGHGGDDSLQGGEGSDTLYGGEGEDALFGSSGNDELHGDGDNDELSGGTGSDKLYGGSGDDTYFFSRGDGQDVVEDTSGAADSISFGFNIDLEDLSLVQDGNDLVIYVLPQDNHAIPLTDVTDTIRIKNWRDTNKAVEALTFASGLTFSLTDLKGNLLQATGTQTVSGSSLRDWIEGHAGNDTLRGGNGNDVLQGRDGNDTLEGGDGIDTLVGGKGDDTLKGGDSTDVLTGGEGSDRLEGGAGNDVYTYQRGDGKDTISESSGDKDMLFLSDVSQNDVVLRTDGADLLVYVKDENQADAPLDQLSDVVRIKGWQNDNTRIETLQFADGSRIELTSPGETVKSNSTVKSILNSAVSDPNGLFRLIEKVSEQFEGKASIIRALEKSNFAGQVTLQKAEFIYMHGLNFEEFIGESPVGEEPFWEIKESSDSYRDELIEIRETLYDMGAWGYFEENLLDPIAFVLSNPFHRDAEFETFEELRELYGWPEQFPSNLPSNSSIVTDALDKLQVAEDYQNYLEHREAIDKLITEIPTSELAQKWSDVISEANELGLNASYDMQGSAEGEEFYTADGDDAIDAKAGDDLLKAYGGNDTLNGGAGDDFLSGGSGNDTFVFSGSSFGKDVITDFEAGEGSEDIIKFDVDVFADLDAVLAAATQNGRNTEIELDEENVITLQNVLKSDLHVDDFQFA
ncbi:calcium-binding protein [Pseudovibrio sp. Ad37]|uniref:calcium-binding protein n=1 Tax=Pseudovibrio sp. Ad37 TaxID=989422 RepID=UPI0007AEB2FF|nr:calcium-binding protein [Pseudovibrio sp. Ad37]KZL26213.1 Bifunctional hemolysin/adenylate cyclase precursor [Pseudovibrio sp. Ad37]